MRGTVGRGLAWLALSAQLGVLPFGAAASREQWSDRDTLLVQRGTVLVSSRLQPAPHSSPSGLDLLDLRGRALPAAASSGELALDRGAAPGTRRRRRRRALPANASGVVATQGLDGTLLAMQPAVLMQMDDILGQSLRSVADSTVGARRVEGNATLPAGVAPGAGGTWQATAPWLRQRLAGVAESLLQLPRYVLGGALQAVRGHAAPWTAAALLQAGDGEGHFNPAYLVLPLLGLGATALVVTALFMRFEKESNRMQGPPQPPTQRSGTSGALGALSARSLRSPLPSMRSFIQPATPGRHEPSPGLTSARSVTLLQRLRSDATLHGAEESEAKPQSLCPSLVVPVGMELVFAVREVLKRERQQLSFCIVSLQGQPLSHVIVNERGRACGIQLQMLDQRPVAMVHTKPVYDFPPGPLEIHRPSGEVFCTISRQAGPENGRHVYALQRPSGQRILTIQGDFHEKSMRVVNSADVLVCDTERCTADFDSSPHYQVRVAPGIDAGLVLCGLLAVDKIEGGSEAR